MEHYSLPKGKQDENFFEP
ncbi:hypothetical protein RSAG8_13987, partial [Rhizoctonia solani AG-8 WAC10335]